jgi:hypothetical protein
MATRTRLALLILLITLPLAAGAGPVFREEGAIYMEDLVQKPIKLGVVADAPIYFDFGLGRYLGTLKRGQFVELQAVSGTAYRVLGQAQQGQVAGWIEPKYLDALKPDFLANIKKAAQRMEEVKALIARKEAAINMTAAEVTACLGKASKLTSRIDASGRHDIWEYIRYEQVPQQVTGYDRFGNLVANTIYVKVPSGKMSVIFDNGLVTALEQSEGTLAKDSQVKIVATPIQVY